MTRIIQSYRGCGYRDPKAAKDEYYCGYPTGPIQCYVSKSSIIEGFPWNCPLKKESKL